MASPRRTRPSSATYPPTSKVSGAPLWSANPRAASSAFDMWKPSMGARPATGKPTSGRARDSSAAIVVFPVPGGPVNPSTRTGSPLRARPATASTMRRVIDEAWARPGETAACGPGASRFVLTA